MLKVGDRVLYKGTRLLGVLNHKWTGGLYLAWRVTIVHPRRVPGYYFWKEDRMIPIPEHATSNQVAALINLYGPQV